MTEKQFTTILIIGQLLCVSLFAIRFFSDYSVVVNNWANEIADCALAYILVLQTYGTFTKKLAPWWLCFFPSIMIGIGLEFFQFFQIKIWIMPVGTFDVIDLPLYLVGAVLALILDLWLIRRNP